MGVCTKRSVLLASNQTDFSSFRLLWATIHQYWSLDFLAIADPSADWNSECLDILDLESYWRCYNPNHNDILVEYLSVGPPADLLLEISDKNIRIYISINPFNWWCYFLSRRQYLAWWTKITIWFWTCHVGCCTYYTDDLGLYCIWLVVPPKICSDGFRIA